jgi:tape measure domain-containing protein
VAKIGIVASQLTGVVSITGASQGKADLLSVGTASQTAQANLTQLQNVAKDVSSILSNRFTAEVKNAQAPLQALARQADAAGLDVSKLASLQMKASESATKLSFAQAQAAATQEKATLITNSGTASVEQIALAQARAAVAAENVAKAENAAVMAFEKVKLEAGNLSSAMNQNTEKAGLFSTILGGLKEKAETTSTSLLSGFKNAAGGILEFGAKLGQTAFGIQFAWQSIQGLGQALLGSNEDMEQTTVAFTQLLGSSQAAGAYLQKLQAFAASTPFEFPELAQDAQQMMAFGFSAQDVIPMLTDIGDAMGAMGKGKEQVAQIVTVFGQMHAAGKLNAQDMMQLTSAGVPAWRFLADAMHLSVAEVMKMTTAGLIPADKAISMIRAGMHDAFGGGMQAQSKTFAGILSTIQDNAMAGWRAFTGPLFEQSKSNMVELGKLVSSKAFQDFATTMGQKVGSALSAVSQFIRGTVIPAFQSFSSFLSQNIIPPIQTAITWFDNFVGHGQSAIPILAGIGAVIAGLLVPAIWSFASGVIAATWPVLAVIAAVGGLTAVFLHFYNTSAQFRTFIADVGLVLQQIGSFIVSTFTPVWEQLVEVWQSQMQPALGQLLDTFKQMQPELKILAEILGGVLLYQIGVLVADIGFFAGALAGIWKGAAEMIGGYVQIFSGYVQIIAGVISFIVDLFTGKFSKLGPDLKVILGGVGEIFSGFGNVLKGIVDGIVGGVVGGFKGMGVSVIGYINDLSHGVQDKTAQAKDAANINTLQMKINTIKHAEETDLGVIQKFDHMRMGIADQLSKTKDETEKKSLEVKLAQVTHAEDTAVKVWESHKKMRTDSESELDKLKKSSAEKFGTIQKDIQGIFGNIGHWFSDRWHEVQGAFGGIGNWFHDRWSEAWAGTTSFFGGIGKWFGDRWHDTQNVFAGIGGWFHDRWQEAWNGVTSFFGTIGKWFTDRWNEVMSSTKPFRDYMGAVFETIWNILVALWGKVSAWFHDRFTEAYNKVVEVFGPIGKWFQDRWQDIVKIFQAVGAWFHDRFTEAWNAVVGAFQFLGKWFSDRWEDTKKIFVGVGMWFHDRWSEAWGFIVAVFTPIGKWFSDRWVDVQNIFKAVGGWFHDRFTEAWNGIVTFFAPIGKWFGDRWNEVMGGVNTFKTNVSNKFTELKNDTTNIFKGLINGIVDQLNNGIGAVESFVNFIGQGLDTIATNLGTKGTIPVAHLARIPHYASGTDSHPGGFAVVGEKGPELTWMPPGSKVATNHITELILSMTGGKIPGYADGIGDIGSKILGWLSGGAKSILDNVMSSLHITAPNLPGMGNLASAMFDKVKGWALSWVESVLPKFSMGGQAVNVPGNVQSWIMQAMGITGVPGSWAGPLGVIAIHESGGNPAAVNLTDSNAAAGHPSQGLFQTIPSTFMAHAIAGHLNILNPIDNTIAAIRYIQGRYGDVFHVPGIMSMASGGSYVGYANGGVIDEPISGVGLRTGTKYAFGERGKELVTPYVPSGVNLAQQSYHAPAASSQSGQGQPIYLQIDGRTFARLNLPYTINEIRNQVGVRI